MHFPPRQSGCITTRKLSAPRNSGEEHPLTRKLWTGLDVVQPELQQGGAGVAQSVYRLDYGIDG
jgi:hypothetical protein